MTGNARYGLTPWKVRIVSIVLSLVLMCTLCLGMVSTAQAQAGPDTLAMAGNIGSPYPGFALRNGQGYLGNSALRGKVIWINFWFEACKPCMAEMGAIEEIVQGYRDRPDFIMLSLTWEEHAAIQRVQAKFPMPYPVYSISEEQCERLSGGRPYPTNVVVDKQGLIRYIGSGGRTVPEEARADIRARILPIIEEALNQ